MNEAVAIFRNDYQKNLRKIRCSKNQRYIKDRPVIKSHYFFYRYCPTTSSEVATTKSQTVTRVYGEQWIVIQNRLLNAISHLELNERRLIMFLSPIVRKAIDSNLSKKYSKLM